MEYKCFPPIESLPRIDVNELCKNFDAILDVVDKKNIAYVIVDENGKDDVVLCPAHWFEFKYSTEKALIEGSTYDLCNV